MPDRMVITKDGRIFLVELKREGESLSPLQIVWHKKAFIRGVEVVVLHGEAEIRQWASTVAKPERNRA
jgi:hypothetical protein